MNWIIEKNTDNRTIKQLSKELNVNKIISSMLVKRGIKTFNQAKDYVENKYNLNVKLPEHPQATHTWKQNVTYTDYELPYEKVFWSLPEVAKKNHYYQNENVKRESIPEFIQRLQKKKSRWLKGTQYANSHSND